MNNWQKYKYIKLLEIGNIWSIIPNAFFILVFKKYFYLVCIVIFFSLSSISPRIMYSQEEATKRRLPTLEEIKDAQEALADPIRREQLSIEAQMLADSLNKFLANDTLVSRGSPSGLDSLVTFFAEDTVRFNLRNKTMRLKGNAVIDFKVQSLNSEIIEIDFKNSYLKSQYGIDSAGRRFGFPKFNDQGEIFFGENISYNFRTKRGTIVSGETKVGESFYFGSKIKRVSENELFIQNGYYTTCDDACPHYHFGSPQMKMAVKDKIFIDPLIFYVEDMPIFIFPFGLFFPNKSGRQSGVIVPSFYFSRNRGVVFQDFGFYWAASDYWDTQFKFDFYSKGGYLAKNQAQWVLRDVFRGAYNVQYGRTRFNIDDKFNTNWSLQLNHNHNINPSERMDVNINFASQDFNRNTSTDYAARIRQNITSNASYSRSFENGSNLSTSFSRDQNLIDDSYSQSIPINYSIPNKTPFKSLISSTNRSWYSWVRDISFSYRSNFTNNLTKSALPGSDTTGKFKFDERNKISHSPGISISPKFGHFTVSPSLSFAANNFFRRTDRVFNSEDSTTSDKLSNGFYTEYWYSMGVSVSTRLFGIADDTRPFFGFVKPSSFGVTAFRHTFQPSVGFSYTPDFSEEKYGFYGRYYDENQNREVKYNRFIRDGGSAPASLSKRLTYSDLHSFEMKVKQGDTLPDKNIELLRLTFSTGFNFAADSLNLSDISMTFRTPSLGFLEFSGNANFTVYDEEKFSINETSHSYRRVNQFLISNGKGAARLTNLSLNLSSTLSSRGVEFSSSFSQDADTTSMLTADMLGGRFLAREQEIINRFDWFGDSSPGFSPINIPWNLNVGLNFNYERFYVNRINRTLNLQASFNFQLTETWKINCLSRFDLIKMEMLTPQINITKDLHCWELLLNWTPTGYNKGFYLKFGIKSSMLQDLKLEKKSSPIFR